MNGDQVGPTREQALEEELKRANLELVRRDLEKIDNASRLQSGVQTPGGSNNNQYEMIAEVLKTQSDLMKIALERPANVATDNRGLRLLDLKSQISNSQISKPYISDS